MPADTLAQQAIWLQQQMKKSGNSKAVATIDVDLAYLSTQAQAFGSEKGSETYEAIYDVNQDEYIGIDDIVKAAESLGSTITIEVAPQTPPQIPTPSELKQSELKEFAQDIRGVVETSVIYPKSEYEEEVVKPLKSGFRQRVEAEKKRAVESFETEAWKSFDKLFVEEAVSRYKRRKEEELLKVKVYWEGVEQILKVSFKHAKHMYRLHKAGLKTTEDTTSKWLKKVWLGWAEKYTSWAQATFPQTAKQSDVELLQARESFRQELPSLKQEFLEETLPAWEKKQYEDFEKFLEEEVYPRRLPSAGEQWIRKPTLPRLADVFYEKAEEARKFAESPLGSIFYPYGRKSSFKSPLGPLAGYGTMRLLGGIAESTELIELVFPGPAPPPPRKWDFWRIAGLGIGGLLIGKGVSWVFDPAVGPAASWFKWTRPGKWLSKTTNKLKWWIRESRVYKKWYEWTGPHYKPFPQVATGEVVLTQLDDPLTFAALKARETAWLVHQSPRMGGVWVSKYIPEMGKKASPLKHLIFRGGKVTVGYLQTLGFEKKLLPLTTQAQVTRMGIHPFIPSSTASLFPRSTATIITPILSLGLTATPKPQAKEESVLPQPPKPSEISIPQPEKPKRKKTQKEMMFPTLDLEFLPSIKKKEKQKPIVPLPSLTKPVQIQKQIQRQVQRRKWIILAGLEFPLRPRQHRPKPKPKPGDVERLVPSPIVGVPPKIRRRPLVLPQFASLTVQTTIQTPPTPSPAPIPKFTIPPPWKLKLPKTRGSRRRKKLMGKWFTRTHPIKTPKQLMQSFFQTPFKKKRKKRRKKRRVA